jgi:phosphopantothenoylcysteine decarboxylase/phosphopantothenate--cysteine ligase
VVVGFAAEHGEGGEQRAREKLERKGVDAVVLNDVSRAEIGFDSTANEVTVVGPGEAIHLPMARKREIADGILAYCSRLLESKRRAKA